MTYPDPADFRERHYISTYATDQLGLVIHSLGVPTNVDANTSVSLAFILTSAEGGPQTIFTQNAVNVGTGTYQVQLTAAQSSTAGLYTLQWTYTLGGAVQTYLTYAEIGLPAPDYDMLCPALKQSVDSVWVRMADMFDSPTGGPNLQTYFQEHFGRGRIAQLLRIAMGRLNTMAQPFMTYTLDDGQGGADFPAAQWGPLLETATWVECIKHLIRSYAEQPTFMGSGNVSRLDRRDYMQRWQSILGPEEQMLKSQLDVFKISQMGLGRPAVLVSGGVYGRYGPTRVAGSVAARPRYWTRFY